MYAFTVVAVWRTHVNGGASAVRCKCSGVLGALYTTEAWPVLGIGGYLLECRRIAS